MEIYYTNFQKLILECNQLEICLGWVAARALSRLQSRIVGL